jgi:hypothetical protein
MAQQPQLSLSLPYNVSVPMNHAPPDVQWIRVNDWLTVSPDSCRPTTTPQIGGAVLFANGGSYNTKSECTNAVKQWQSSYPDSAQKWYQVDSQLGYCIPFNGPVGKSNPLVFDSFQQCTNTK